MIEVFIITLMVFGLAMFGLSVGVIFNKKQIKGHCSGNPSIPEKCIKDAYGNRIEACADCDCVS
ncbi:hypothetical protein KKA14_19250 [bacterium]|nr:hypothetical protein [bacterium]